MKKNSVALFAAAVALALTAGLASAQEAPPPHAGQRPGPGIHGPRDPKGPHHGFKGIGHRGHKGPKHGICVRDLSELNLSPDQEKRIVDMLTDAYRARIEAKLQQRAADKKLREDIKNVLTPEQRERFEKMPRPDRRGPQPPPPAR